MPTEEFSNFQERLNNLSLENVTKELNPEELAGNSISYFNQTSNGWGGISIILLFMISIFLFIKEHKIEFNFFHERQVMFLTMILVTNISIFFFQFGLLTSLQFFIYVYLFTFLLGTYCWHKKKSLG